MDGVVFFTDGFWVSGLFLHSDLLHLGFSVVSPLHFAIHCWVSATIRAVFFFQHLARLYSFFPFTASSRSVCVGELSLLSPLHSTYIQSCNWL